MSKICSNCGKESDFRTNIAIIHDGEMKDKIEYLTTTTFYITIRNSHLIGLCKECRKNMTIKDMYKILGD